MARKSSKSSKSSKSNSSFDIYQLITDAIVKLLDQGTVPWRKPWKGGSANAPRNIRGTHYRGINVWLLTAAQIEGGYTSNVWLTFKQAESKGLKINKGERSTLVVFWKWLNVDDENDDGTTTRKRIPLLRYFRVFNLEQTDAPRAEVDETIVETEVEPIDACEQLAAGYADAPPVKHRGARACYSPGHDEILMPARKRFTGAEEYYCTLFHEFAHSTGHADRLSRDEITRAGITFGDHAYSKEELTAEFAAAFLCGVAGIEATTIDNSAAYIANWRKALKGNNKLVVQAAQRAQKAADWIQGIKPAHDEN